MTDYSTHIRSLDLDESIKEAAIANLDTWLEGAKFADYRPQLEDLIAREQWIVLVDSFYQEIPFGTGGQRGPVGIGPNRFNAYTLAGSIQGHAEYLKLQQQQMGWDSFSVVVAYDVRQFNDRKQVYSTDVPNPILGLSSKDFARIAAGVYAANSIIVWMLPDAASAVIPTPELSFLIRHLEAQGGLNISASHNPPDDNGAKLYNFTGGQEVPPNDEEMVKLVAQVDEVKHMDYEEAKAAGCIRFIPDEARKLYIDAILQVSLQREYREATVVFSPLHGAGKYTGGLILEEAGFNVVRVEEQWEDDGNFSTVPNGIANPEEPPAMVTAARIARDVGGDIAMATDPDADRMGAVAPDGDGRWHFLDGNQIGALLASYVLETRTRFGALPPKPLVIKTEVTTSILERIARAFGAHFIGHLLVGFKYIGDILRQIEATGEFEGEAFTLDDYLFGTEESHGYLVTTAVRDKDSAGACLLLAELAAECKSKGITIIDYLNALYERYGFTRNVLVSLAMSGAEGKVRMGEMLDSLRSSPPETIGRWKVSEMIDLRDPESRFGPIKSETDRNGRNVLLFELEGGYRSAIRPSGTEPKTKIYFEGTEPVGDGKTLAEVRAQVDVALTELSTAFTGEMLSRAGVSPDDEGVKVSGLDSLETKQNFDKLL